ncbi:hypothetical protein ASZ90_017727 [hydrocarbon metagenome]|uniref:Uncharacterized protein n=1 Tax=hydrocarbon metagenome TaxID=938273 RepID=A0A0W8E880_9ZZZZ
MIHILCIDIGILVPQWHSFLSEWFCFSDFGSHGYYIHQFQVRQTSLEVV